MLSSILVLYYTNEPLKQFNSKGQQNTWTLQAYCATFIQKLSMTEIVDYTLVRLDDLPDLPDWPYWTHSLDRLDTWQAWKIWQTGRLDRHLSVECGWWLKSLFVSLFVLCCVLFLRYSYPFHFSLKQCGSQEQLLGEHAKWLHQNVLLLIIHHLMLSWDT